MNLPVGNRVLILLENSTYPIDPRVRQEATTLTDAGYQVSVICPRAFSQPWYENLNGVHIFRYPMLRAQGFFGYVFEYTYSLFATFVTSLFVWVHRGFDIIHATNPPDIAVFIALFYKLFGKRFIFDHHDLAPEMYLVRFKHKGTRIVYQLLLWLEKISCQCADHIITTNQSQKNVEIERDHVSDDRITIVRNGPVLDCFKKIQPDKEMHSRNVTVFGYIGVIGPQDGLDYLLRSLHLLITVLGRNDFSCKIIGEGSALATLKSQTIQLELHQYLCFTGFMPQKDALTHLSTVDICVDPDPSNIYNDHCTMIKMMEYMALGKPIVAFDLPEHRVSAGEAALYARPNDELHFAQRLLELMDNPDRCTKMGKIGRERIENEFSWSYQAKHLLNAYSIIRGT